MYDLLKILSYWVDSLKIKLKGINLFSNFCSTTYVTLLPFLSKFSTWKLIENIKTFQVKLLSQYEVSVLWLIYTNTFEFIWKQKSRSIIYNIQHSKIEYKLLLTYLIWKI